ncbi:MAG: response regulator [Gammaproteobacteria bacterium CG22_combo_CG10-13_8_21_14_all_40_8]|nr:MAG: response regulator [Gammaproteobacteria bacterium CG22_combo_CG10-13_8_21_14_all_40_8]
MALSVLICDDSSFARKQLSRALPDMLAHNVEFAGNGQEALELLRAGAAELLFLDLNMPVMDGYQTLEAISREELDVTTIVVSGDIQTEAKTRVLALGALDFIKKPITKEQLAAALIDFGILSATQRQTPEKKPPATTTKTQQPQTSLIDTYQEITNVAMGQAASLLAELLGVFIQLPIPNVNEMDFSDLQMFLADAHSEEDLSVICQGFIGFGISGEALLTFNNASTEDLSKLMSYHDSGTVENKMELLMDVSSILIGACLNSIAKQLDINFSQGSPVILGQQVKISDLLASNNQKWKKNLAIEINYAIEGYNINCDLIVLFTEDSLPNLARRAGYLMEVE